jgi:hypothetical protein
MTGPLAAAPDASAKADPAELARLGIVRVASEHFLVGSYRYSRLADAIAEARRGHNPESDA